MTNPTAVSKTPSFGIRLRQLRRAAGLKQATLAKQAGVSRSYLAAIEAGHRGKRPGFGVVQRLAVALGLTLAQLVETPVCLQAQHSHLFVSVIGR